MLTKWWKSELMLATNFGSLCPKVTKVGSQNFGYQIWFCTRLLRASLTISKFTLAQAKAWGFMKTNSINCPQWVDSSRLRDTYMSADEDIIDSYDGLSPVQHQAIIWTSNGLMLIGPMEKGSDSEWAATKIYPTTKIHPVVAFWQVWSNSIGCQLYETQSFLTTSDLLQCLFTCYIVSVIMYTVNCRK